MFRSIIIAISMMITGSALAAHQIDLVGPRDVTIPSGWSNVTADLPTPIAVNPFKVVFWNMGSCKVIPLTNISVKYKSIPYWSSTEWKDGAYYADGDEAIVAIKLDFYQTQVQSQVCVLKVSGFIP